MVDQKPYGVTTAVLISTLLSKFGGDAAAADSTLTLGFDSEDCHADYRTATGPGAETIEAPQDRPWGARSAYLKGPGGLTVEIEQLLKRT